MKASEAEAILHTYVDESCRKVLKEYGMDEKLLDAAKLGAYRGLLSMCLVYLTDEQKVQAMPHVFRDVA